MVETDSASFGLAKSPENPGWVKASYGCREMFGQWITGVFSAFGIFFYKQVIGLSAGLVTLAFVIWAVWNAFNDPIVGFIMEKYHFLWERKKGFRRFPWIVLGAIPWIISYFMLYMVPLEWTPEHDQWKIFIWLLVSLFFYDLFGTIYDVNVLSLFPVKFQTLEERRKVQGWGTILGIVGITLAFIIPPMFIGDGPRTYRDAALVSLIGAFFLFSLALPGVYENAAIRKYNLHTRAQNQKQEPQPFFAYAKSVFSNKTFMIKVLFFFGYQASVALINASALYVIKFTLDVDETNLTLLLGSMLVGALITVPLWLHFANKVNDNKKMSIYGALFMILSYIPMIFVSGIAAWIFCLFLFGVGLGGQWFMDPPTMGDILDDVAVKTGRRQDSIYYGYQSFIIRFGEAFKVIIISMAHYMTGFPDGVANLEELNASVSNIELALFGIRIHTAIVPLILVIVATLVFWKYYTLTPERVQQNKQKLLNMAV